MEPITNYNILQEIDPTKVKVHITDRFAKLTLSSNKKKQQNHNEPDQQQEQIKKQQEKRQSVSRNISKQFEIEGNENKSNSAQNPLLLSESSKDTDYNNPVEANADADVDANAFDLTMEPLEVSEDSENSMKLDHDMELLSQQIASMIVQPKAISLSSGSTENVSVLTELFSSESQRSSSSVCNNVYIVHNIPINVEEAVNQSTIPLNLTNITNENPKKAYELTDESEEFEEESEVITVSDTSDSHHESNQPEEDIMATSSLPSVSASSDNLKLPSLIDQKADRVAAFLRDVSIEQRVMKEQGLTVFTDTIDQILDHQDRSRQIATADTESMTPDAEEDVNPVLERVKRLKALEEAENKLPNSERTTVKNLHRMASNETLDNTILTELDKKDYLKSTETHNKILSSTLNNIIRDTQNDRRLANLETEENTEFSLIERDYSSPNKHKENDSRLLLSKDINDIDVALTQQSEKLSRPMVNDEALNSSSISVINSSDEINETVPEHSITILETDDENLEQKSLSKDENSDNQKLSHSFQQEDSSHDSDYEENMSKIKMSMSNINISAKINIKIHISNMISTETSEDDGAGNEGNTKLSNDYEYKTPSENESKEQSIELEQTKQTPCHQKQLKAAVAETSPVSSESANDSGEIVEDEKFVAEAEKILTQLYGTAWQTPDVMRTLKRSSQSGDKKSNKSKPSSTKKRIVLESSEKKSAAEETLLDDFTIFRRNIVKTNLDSTRMVTPKSAKQKVPILNEEPATSKNYDAAASKENVTNQKTYNSPAAKRRVNNRNKWRHLLNSESENENASDDEDADKSWSRSASELELQNSDSDFEPSPKARNRKNHTTKRAGRSEKSDNLIKILNKSKADEIFYLDLSKEEVEIQKDVPDSPPVNHDANFALRLQDILKTCRHEDKPKLPASNNKTKRKLFTPNFGDDDVEAELPPKTETKPKELTATTKWESNNDEILRDELRCPFDRQGRPKVLDVVNKPLEALKTGRAIFELTPPSIRKAAATSNSITKNPKSGDRKNTNKIRSQQENEAVFKTPLTTGKTRGDPAKVLKELLQTPIYKYSFLKSLDVTVSKTLCHPDALYYRENYRSKKEDLSKILYEFYNEKLFDNKLAVSLIWNKNLLSTAGRCVNKKKLGNRSCIIELSDKVLTSADRLRCTLIHELCHAATWIFNGEGGHGTAWKEWARRANATFPELPVIRVCHQYDIEYKYTYKCTLCAAKSHAHSKSKKVANIRCSYCHGAIEIFLNKKDKDGNVMPTPVREPTGFAKFVKDNYKKFKRENLQHGDVMKLLSSEFASLKVACN